MRMKAAPISFARWFGAEFIGTMLLAAVAGTASLASGGSLPGYDFLYVPFAVGLLVMVMVYLVGSISGAHFNPAVTLTLFAFRKVSVQQLVTYLVAQFAGAWVGVQLTIQFVGVAPAEPGATDRGASMAEFMGALLLVFAIMHVVLGKVKDEMAGIVIGAALVLGLTLAMATGAGVLNPAVAYVFGSGVTATYLLMPILGGLAGGALAVLLHDHQ